VTKRLARDAPRHAKHIAQVEKFFATSSHGLTTGEAAERLTRLGPNALRGEPPLGLLAISCGSSATSYWWSPRR
jgi:Cation transporter/ATPase, N-terminus